MSTSEDISTTTIPPEDADVTAAAQQLIAMREAAYQRWLAERPANPFPSEIAGLPPYELFYRAFNEGWMACWGDYRDIILASQDEQ